MVMASRREACVSLPFQEVLAPVVRTARRLTWSALPYARTLLTPAARGDLDRSLLQRLTRVADRTLFVEFVLFRHEVRRGSSHGPHALLPALDLDSRRIYEAFIRAMRAGGFDRLRARYPVLNRLLLSTVAGWRAQAIE